MDNNNVTVLENQPVADTKKNLGCWARFKCLFEDRGFDLHYEYGRTPRPINLLGENQDAEGYRRISERKPSLARTKKTQFNSTAKNSKEDNDLSCEINFYEQFTTLNDEETKEEPDLWRKSVRRRVSMRPSAILTNIMEEPDDEIEVVSEYFS